MMIAAIEPKYNNSDIVISDNILNTTANLLRAPISNSTKRAYKVQWKNFNAFCNSIGVMSLPSSAQSIVLYISKMFDDKKSISYINQSMAAIALMNTEKGFNDNTKDIMVKRALKNARRDKKTDIIHKKDAATIEVIETMVDSIDRTTLKGKRDAAILLVGFFTACRRSELCNLNYEDIKPILTKDGKKAFEITIRYSKTDQEGNTMLKALFPVSADKIAYCPVNALTEYLKAANITNGAIFKRVLKGNKMLNERITPQSIALLIKHTATKCNITLDLAAHSLRSGFITTALLNGATERQTMNQSGHKSATIMRGYLRRVEVIQDNAAETIAKII